MGKISDLIDKHKREKQEVSSQNFISGCEHKKDDDFKLEFTRDYIKVRKVSEKLVAALTPDSVTAEMFKVIREMILHDQNHLTSKAIMITSALPGEGKTFVACNVAASFAMVLNKNVLLIDSDLRRPSVHTMFGYTNEYGLSDYLQGRKKIRELLIKTNIKQVSLLLSGATPSNPVELLTSEKMEHFIEEAKDRYPDRFIIIDTTPSRMTAETNIIAKHVDGILLVVRNGETPQAILQQTVEKLGRKKILGIVFNDYTQPLKYYKKYYHKYYR